jgi:pilus assembly protein CpaF
MEGEMITLQNLYEHRVEHIDADGKVVGGIYPTGLRPSFLNRFQRHGIEVPPELFGAVDSYAFGQNGNGRFPERGAR